jgi:hypothetical protein
VRYNEDSKNIGELLLLRQKAAVESTKLSHVGGYDVNSWPAAKCKVEVRQRLGGKGCLFRTLYIYLLHPISTRGSLPALYTLPENSIYKPNSFQVALLEPYRPPCPFSASPK